MDVFQEIYEIMIYFYYLIMKTGFESDDSFSVNNCSDEGSSQIADWKSALIRNNDIEIDLEEGEKCENDLQKEFPYKISKKLSRAVVDLVYKSYKVYAKSTNLLYTKSILDLEEFESKPRNEELRLDLGQASQFVLDESRKFYKKKEVNEDSGLIATEQMKPLRFNTCNIINSNADRLNLNKEVEKARRIKISCQKIIFEYDNSDSENDIESTKNLQNHKANYIMN